MQVAKVDCVGKTFALAKHNDSSGGKKSKRRSKEERKQMVEIFIKRHRASNNGSFPSLNLTHKEVGGSYYTVREIFRELIQENRVLAPPKLLPGEQNIENVDSVLENYPLGTISFDPNVHGLAPKDNQTLLNEYEFRREKAFNSKKISELRRQSLDKDDIVNGSKNTTMEIVEIHPMSEDIVVETFPLRPVSSMVYDVDEKTSDGEVLDGDVKLATGNIESFVKDEIDLPDRLKEAVDTKSENTSLAENKALSSQNPDSNNSINFVQQPHFGEKTTKKNKSDIHPSGTAQKQTIDTALNKINLESLDGASSKETNSQEADSFVSFIKTCVTAFVKFWSK